MVEPIEVSPEKVKERIVEFLHRLTMAPDIWSIVHASSCLRDLSINGAILFDVYGQGTEDDGGFSILIADPDGYAPHRIVWGRIRDEKVSVLSIDMVKCAISVPLLAWVRVIDRNVEADEQDSSRRYLEIELDHMRNVARRGKNESEFGEKTILWRLLVCLCDAGSAGRSVDELAKSVWHDKKGTLAKSITSQVENLSAMIRALNLRTVQQEDGTYCIRPR